MNLKNIWNTPHFYYINPIRLSLFRFHTQFDNFPPTPRHLQLTPFIVLFSNLFQTSRPLSQNIDPHKLTIEKRKPPNTIPFQTWIIDPSSITMEMEENWPTVVRQPKILSVVWESALPFERLSSFFIKKSKKTVFFLN